MSGWVSIIVAVMQVAAATAPAAPSRAVVVHGDRIGCVNHQCVMPRETWRDLQPNLMQILGKARAVAVTKDGRPHGYRILGIRRGDLLSRLSVQNGDTVLAVNDLPLNDPAGVWAAYTKLGTLSHWTFTLERRGAPLTIGITLQ